MTKSQLIVEGVNLMFVGMGFVMLFLLLLIGAIALMSQLINRFFPETVNSPQLSTTHSNTQPASDDIAHLRPVIVAAINHHRRQQGIHD